MKYLIGNWKSNFEYENLEPYFKEFNNLLTNKQFDFKLMLAIPDLWLLKAKELASNQIECCAQNINESMMGSYSGSNNVLMVKSVVDYTLLNHSEVRKYLFDDNLKVNIKLKASLNNNLKIILCIGEPLDVYNNNQTINYLINQLSEILKDINNLNQDNLIIAYEPLWAIGSGLIPKNEQIYDVIKQLKQYLFNEYNTNFDFLYGGSVNNKNIETLIKIDNLSGFLIGNLSLKVDEFFRIVHYFNYNK